MLRFVVLSANECSWKWKVCGCVEDGRGCGNGTKQLTGSAHISLTSLVLNVRAAPVVLDMRLSE